MRGCGTSVGSYEVANDDSICVVSSMAAYMAAFKFGLKMTVFSTENPLLELVLR